MCKEVYSVWLNRLDSQGYKHGTILFSNNFYESDLLTIPHPFSAEWQSSLVAVQFDSIHFFCHLWLLEVSFQLLRLSPLHFKTKYYHDCLTSVSILHCSPEAQKSHTSLPCCLCMPRLTFVICSQSLSLCLGRVQHVCSVTFIWEITAHQALR